MKTCPHCHADTFGSSQLLALDYFATDECRECKQLVRNDGLRQFLVIPAILGSLAVGLLLLTVVPDVLQPFAILLTFSLVALALTVLPKPVKYVAEVQLPSFSPDPDNDKIIAVSGWNETELGQILDDFITQYRSGWPPYRVEIVRQNANYLRLTFPEDIHPCLFAFLVNYARYPIGFELARRKITVVGQTTLDNSFDGIPEELFGQKAVLCTSENDEEYDIVYLQSETGLNFANSLGENNWREVDARVEESAAN